MECMGTVVHVELFQSKKNGKIYSKLFVPIGYEVVSVIAQGDCKKLAGTVCEFRLGMDKQKKLQLFFDGGVEE